MDDMMKRLALALALGLFSTSAWSQCNGVFPANTVCGSLAGGIAGPVTFGSFAAGITVGTTTISGGTSNTILYNNAGILGQLGLGTTGTILQGNTGAAPSFTATPILGVAGSVIGTLRFSGNTSGVITVTPQAAAGTATLTLPNTAGTFAVGASSPLVLSTTTGNLTCPTCATSSGGGAITGTAPVAVSAAGVVSITGVAGQILAGATPAFTATPTLGASGTLGSLTFGNATSGLLTLQPVTGALGTVTVSLPAATDTLVGKATTDTFTNKTFDTAGSGNVFRINGTAISAVTGTGAVVLASTPTIATPNFTTSFSVDSATFGSHSTDYHIMFAPNGRDAFTAGNATDPTNYYKATTHTFSSADGVTPFVSFLSSGVLLYGSTSGNTVIKAAATASGTLTFPAGTTNFSATGGASQVVKQTSAGGALTVAQVAVGDLSTVAASTLLGNATTGTAAPTAFTIAGLTTKASPAAGDYVIISDEAASSAYKKVTVSSLASAGSVSSIAGNTGAFTLGAGLTNSTNVLLVDPTYLNKFLSGCVLSNNVGTPNTIIDIAACASVSDDATTLMKTAAFTKTTAAWAVGTGNGGLDTGSVANNTWYHIFQIVRPDTGIVDFLLSTSATAPTMPANYTKKRRIGAIKTATGAATIMTFYQIGDEFLWDSPVSDINVTDQGTTAVSRTLTVPTGVQVWARYRGGASIAGGAMNMLYSSLSVADLAPGTPTGNASTVSQVAGVLSANELRTLTNTSGQIRTRSTSASTNLQITTFGWDDPRGK